MKILLCDIDEKNIKIFEDYLFQEGHSIVTTGDAQTTMQVFTQLHPDLVFIDEQLPGQDILSLIYQLKEQSYQFSDWVPIALMSKALTDASIEQALDAGADFFLHKPVSLQIVRAKIQTTRKIISFRQNLIDFGKQLRDLNDKLLASNQLLSELSLKDPLTMLANRRAFEENLERLCRLTCRQGTPLSLMMIDVDHFKYYNDTYGHQAGDVCLQKVAQALHDSLYRSKDIVARYGGEEFSVILPETTQEEAAKVAERIRTSVESIKLKNIGSPKGIVTVSIGVATSTPGVLFTSDALVAAADEALYQAKDRGRNAYVLSSQAVTENKAAHVSGYKSKIIKAIADQDLSTSNIATKPE